MKHVALMVLPVIACSALAEEDPLAGDESNKAVVEKDDAFKVVADPAGKAYFPEGRASYYTKELLAMMEPSVLSPLEKGVERVFRFTYLRSFHDSLVVRITEAGGTTTIRAVQLERDLQYRPVRIAHDKTWKLDEEGRKAVKPLPEQKGFWTPISDIELAVALSFSDGSKWIFEVHDKNGYRMIDIQSPDRLAKMELPGPEGDPTKPRDYLAYKKTGEKLLKLAGILPAKDERY